MVKYSNSKIVFSTSAVRQQDTKDNENNRIYAAYPHLFHKQYLQWPSPKNGITIEWVLRGFVGFGFFLNLEYSSTPYSFCLHM